MLAMEEWGKVKISGLPSDILVDVLSRLPEKSLFRFVLVSKQWHHLISSSDPGLVKHVRRQRLRASRYLYSWSSKHVDLPYLNPWSSKHIDHCGGYTLCVSIADLVNERIQESYDLSFTDSEYPYIVSYHNIVCIFGTNVSIFNLSTQEKAKIPNVDVWGVWGCPGVGYSSLSHEFKLAQWRTLDGHGGLLLSCDIFSLSDRLKFSSSSWKSIQTRPCLNLDYRTLSVNGSIYWLIYKNKDRDGEEYSYNYTDSFLALDLDKEKTEIISCPEPSPKDILAYLVELRECVYLAHCRKGEAKVKMWRLEDPKNCIWVLEYCIDFQSIRDAIVPLTSMSVNHVEEIVFLSSMGEQVFKVVLFYNVESGTLRKSNNLDQLKVPPYEFPCVLRYLKL